MKPQLENNKPIAVLGCCNSGKTNLAVFLARQSNKPKMYTLGYPTKIDGFINLSSMDDLFQIENCVVFIDEIDRYIKIYDKKSNEQLYELLKFTEHNRIKLIFTTQISQFVTKGVKAFVPCWEIKQNKRRIKMKQTYNFKNENTKILRAINMSLTLKKRFGWDKTEQAHFTIRNINNIEEYGKGRILLNLKGQGIGLYDIKVFNIKELYAIR